MTIQEANTYIRNWDNISEFFSPKAIKAMLEIAELKEFSRIEHVPVDSEKNNFYERMNYEKTETSPTRRFITEYCQYKGSEWTRRVEVPCYSWRIPCPYQNKEASVVRKGLLTDFPYLEKYEFDVYHFDSTSNRETILKKQKEHPLNKNWWGMEIYVHIGGNSLYVPVIALKEKDSDIIVSRHAGYNSSYYTSPSNKPYLERALALLKAPQTQVFFDDVKNLKKKFKLPVTWEVCGEIEVEAKDLEEAVRIFDNDPDIFSLPEKTEYVDASFDLSCREISYLELFQK